MLGRYFGITKTFPGVGGSTVRFFASLQTPRGTYANLEDTDLNIFENIVGKRNVKTEDLNGFNHDWMGQFKGGE